MPFYEHKCGDYIIYITKCTSTISNWSGSLIFHLLWLPLMFFLLMFWKQNYANEESLAPRFSGELKKGGTRMFILMNLEVIMALRLEMCSLLNWAIFTVINLLYLTIIPIFLGGRGRVQSCTWSEHHAKGSVSKANFFSLLDSHFNYLLDSARPLYRKAVLRIWINKILWSRLRTIGGGFCIDHLDHHRLNTTRMYR